MRKKSSLAVAIILSSGLNLGFANSSQSGYLSNEKSAAATAVTADTAAKTDATATADTAAKTDATATARKSKKLTIAGRLKSKMGGAFKKSKRMFAQLKSKHKAAQ